MSGQWGDAVLTLAIRSVQAFDLTVTVCTLRTTALDHYYYYYYYYDYYYYAVRL
ncbi:hypothetical protein LZ31DRAFT_559174 [Colletotrichum somersetense]|nr:hypothetical protein LZ31DRAFT_559174 [Colletotrichum somersetense]